MKKKASWDVVEPDVKAELDLLLEAFEPDQRSRVLNRVREFYAEGLEEEPNELAVRGAAEFLWEEAGTNLTRYLHGTLSASDELVTEAVMDAMLTYFEVARRQRISDPSGLLYVIARRRVVDQYRRDRSRSLQIVYDTPMLEGAIENGQRSSPITDAELRIAVDQVLSSWLQEATTPGARKSRKRAIAAFEDWLDRDLLASQIAERLEVSPKTISRDLALIFDVLRRRIYNQQERS